VYWRKRIGTGPPVFGYGTGAPFWIRNPVYVMDTGSHSFHVTVLRVPGLNCRGSTRQLTIIEMNESFDEIRNNSSAIFQFLQGGFVSTAAVSSPHQQCGRSWEGGHVG
jgi:hypothetical protein